MNEWDDLTAKFHAAANSAKSAFAAELKKLPEAIACPTGAEGHWSLLDVEASLRGHKALYLCPQCIAATRQRRYERLQEEAGIPRDVRHATLTNFEVDRPGLDERFHAPVDFLKAACAVARRQAWMTVFAGDVGLGKGHLAAALCNLRLKNGYTAKFIRVDALVSSVMQTFGTKHSARDEAAILRSCTEPDLLVLDEAALTPMTNTTERIIYDVLQERRDNEKQVVMTTNQPKVSHDSALAIGFENWFGSRSLSRLNDFQGRPYVWRFGRWSDYRKRGEMDA